MPNDKSPGRNAPWIRDELILALDLYVKHSGNPPGKGSSEIEELSKLLNTLGLARGQAGQGTYRNANGAYMKVMNFRRFDPHFTSAGKKGLSHGNRLEEAVWNDFANEPAKLASVAAAIRATLTSDEGQKLAQDLPVDDDFEAAEGKVLTAVHRRRERNRTLIEKRKQKALNETGDLRCEGCGMSFEERYGEVGRGFIEVHHTRPVHQLKPGDKTRISELALVCANCHRMIHRRRPWLSISDLKAIAAR